VRFAVSRDSATRECTGGYKPRRITQPLFCSVELGGTKCVCLLGTSPDVILDRATVNTRGDAAVTLGLIEEILRSWEIKYGVFNAIGVACFGPLELRGGSCKFGRIGATPKKGWADVDVAGFFKTRFAGPVGITTDVIAAALAEGRWGAAAGLTDYAYITVGTGVGVGLIVGGKPLGGWHHPELGHIRIARAEFDAWPGNCRFHGACVEGLASGPAIEARAGMRAAELPLTSPVWDTVAHALAQLAHNLVLAVAPQRIVIGGGVATNQLHLFPRTREKLRCSVNGYVDLEEGTGGLDKFIVPPALGALAGPLGALAVAADALSSPLVKVTKTSRRRGAR
jgi:fructokinase